MIKRISALEQVIAVIIGANRRLTLVILHLASKVNECAKCNRMQFTGKKFADIK